MNFDAAYYLWAKEQVENDLANDFQFLKSLNSSLTWRFIQAMTGFQPATRSAVWKSLLKRFHKQGAIIVGDEINADDVGLINEYMRALNASYATVARENGISKQVSKRKFIASVVEVVEDLLNARPQKHAGLVVLQSYEGNWMVETYLDGQSSNYQLCYWHNVYLSSGILIRERCSALEWMGVSSQTSWSEVSEEQMPGIIDSLRCAIAKFVKFCRFQNEAAREP